MSVTKKPEPFGMRLVRELESFPPVDSSSFGMMGLIFLFSEILCHFQLCLIDAPITPVKQIVRLLPALRAFADHHPGTNLDFLQLLRYVHAQPSLPFTGTISSLSVDWM